MKIRERIKSINRNELSDRIRTNQLDPEDQRVLLFFVRVIPRLLQALQKSKLHVQKLRKMIWGKKTESSRDILKDIEENEIDKDIASDASSDFDNQEAEIPFSETPPSESNFSTGSETSYDSKPPTTSDNVIPIGKSRKYKKGRKNGARGAAAYPDAEIIKCLHTLKAGDKCPLCPKGKLYLLKNVYGKFIQFIGQPFLKAKVYFQEKLRCNSCYTVFTAPLPPEAGGTRGTKTAAAIVAVLKYGTGFPYFRMSYFQKMQRMPISPSGLWNILEDLIEIVQFVWKEMRRIAAQGEIFHNDDTTNKILSLIKSSKLQIKKNGQRKGVFTTGILSKLGSRTIVLFFTGNKNSRENLEALLDEREEGLKVPIQMSDASTTNPPRNKPTQQGCCLTHGRRGFVESYRSFKKASTYVIRLLKKVYKTEALAKEKKLNPEERLKLHQELSAPVMHELKEWMNEQFNKKLVEENSQLGESIQYMFNHWEKLTLFLRVAGAPLTNDELEQKFKMIKLHLKNSMFYKTLWGAQVGDMFMSLIHTCNLAGESPYEYFIQLQEHKQEVKENPKDWMPWNFKATLQMTQAATLNRSA